jgi:FkbM family methyltransferase
MKAVINLARFFASHPLTRATPIKAWSRYLSWQIKSRIRDEVIVPWIGGQRLAIKRGMTGATGNVYAGLHEFSDMMFLLHFLRAGDLFMDIGANVGTYTVLASGVCRALTCAFEPDPGAARALRRNIALNSLDDLVTLHTFVLGDCDSEVPFTVGLDTMNKVVAAEGQLNVRILPQHRLDTVIGESTPIMIKLDVEGYEENVLRGAATVLARTHLQAIELETTTPTIENMLSHNGFERRYYDPFSRLLARQPIDVPSANSLFVRESAFIISRVEAAKKIKVLDRMI